MVILVIMVVNGIIIIANLIFICFVDLAGRILAVHMEICLFLVVVILSINAGAIIIIIPIIIILMIITMLFVGRVSQYFIYLVIDVVA